MEISAGSTVASRTAFAGGPCYLYLKRYAEFPSRSRFVRSKPRCPVLQSGTEYRFHRAAGPLPFADNSPPVPARRWSECGRERRKRAAERRHAVEHEQQQGKRQTNNLGGPVLEQFVSYVLYRHYRCPPLAYLHFPGRAILPVVALFPLKQDHNRAVNRRPD